MNDPNWQLPKDEDTADVVFRNKPNEVEAFLEEADIFKILEYIPEKYRELCLV